MKNAIFTICAKNYLAQAKSLGYSLKETNPDVDFYIILADEIEEQNLGTQDFNLIEGRAIGIEKFYEMAFKYNVIEFNTSIKPFCIDYLFKNFGYDKILYLDPDMIVYDKLSYLFDKLDEHDAIITPHILKPYIKYQGATPEEELLFVGIYNLGFFGVKNTEIGLYIVEWWKEKLTDQCYADKEDGLHVDQKWMDFLPSLYTKEVGIIRHPGVNAAFWNMHEREFINDGDNYKVDGEPLLIYHFSGLDVETYQNICRKQTKYNLENKPEYRKLFEEYVEMLKANSVFEHKKMIYTYNTFNNGVFIIPFQRRLLRGLLKQNYTLTSNPFTVGPNTLYALLEKNGLVISDKQGKFSKLQKSYPNYKALFEKANKVMNIFKKTIGIKRYYMIMRYLDRHIRFEDQLFLINNRKP